MARPFEAFNRLIAEHDMIPSGSTVLCALSGGADSVYLLHRLYLLRTVRDFRLVAAHYNHHLRGEESERDEEFVRRFVEKWCSSLIETSGGGHRELPAVPLFVGGGDVAKEAARRKTGLEETAREMRYEFLRKTAQSLGGAIIATAHTADDNAETMLFHLARGSGLRGLTGIRPKGDGLIRPMLTTTRAQVEEYLRLYSIPHVEDSSNADERFARNRLRHRVIPEMEDLCPGVVERTAFTASLLRADEDYLTDQAEKAVEGIEPENDLIRIPAVAISDLPDALASRAVRILISRMRGGDTDLAAAHLLSVVAISRGADPSASVSLPGGLAARREYDDLVLDFVGNEPKTPDPVPVTIDGQTVYGDTGWTVFCSQVICPEKNCKNPDSFFLARDKIAGALVLRPRQTGDHIKLPGRGTRTVKKLFIDKKIPLMSRGLLPVLADDDGVVALASFGPDEFRLAQPGEPALWITLKKE